MKAITHTRCFYDVIADIQRIASPIYYETNAITVKTT